LLRFSEYDSPPKKKPSEARKALKSHDFLFFLR